MLLEDRRHAQDVCAHGRNQTGKAADTPQDEASAQTGPTGELMPCPPDREELGNHTWTLLHTMAAYFPNEPSPTQVSSMHAFVHALGGLFPCTHCAEDFREAIKESPPRANSRAELSVWMCEMHNQVNEKLGKPTYSCDLAHLDMRWRTGAPHCDALDLADNAADDQPAGPNS